MIGSKSYLHLLARLSYKEESIYTLVWILCLMKIAGVEAWYNNVLKEIKPIWG
jgi:hypothetical protein